MGDVFCAYDRERGAEVALKLLARRSPGGLYRFKREFRSLAEISHPNLVALYEMASHGDEWFFTMELVRGASFLDYVRGPEVAQQRVAAATRETQSALLREVSFTQDTLSEAGGPLPESLVVPASSAPPLESVAQFERLFGALHQLVEAIQALHAAGHLHRDIKPSNVLVGDDGRLVVLDFGVALTLDARDHFHEANTLVGTPAYMAPEQARGHGTRASDWYAVGTMLYEALTGRRPFQAGAAELLLRLKNRYRPEDPEVLAPRAPRRLLELCRNLLSIEPQRRSQGHEIAAALGDGDSGRMPADRGSPSSVFVGRHDEIRDLYAHFAGSARRCRVACVAGPSGSGKSQLAEHFLDSIRPGDDVLILSGRCFERESVPYKALDSLIDDLCGYLAQRDPAELAELVPPHFETLARVFPVLRRLEWDWEEEKTPDPYELWRRGVAALRELLLRLSKRQRLVLYIDDVQWGDRESAALLAEALAEPGAPRVLVLATHRTENGRSQFLQSLARRQLAMATVEVEPLSDDDARSLAAMLLGARAATRIGTNAELTVVDEIVAEAGGNPFFVVALARAWGSEISPGDTDVLPRGQVTLDELLRDRYRELPPPSRRLLEVVCVAGLPIARDVAHLAASLGDQAQSAEILLRNSGLVRALPLRSGEALVAFHDRIREAIAGAVPAARRRHLHANLARSLEASGGADPETLAFHLEGAGRRQRAAVFAAEAARGAFAALAFARAAELFGKALELGEWDAAIVGELQRGLADSLANAGRGVEAAEAYRAAAGNASPGDALDCGRLEAEQYLKAGHIKEGLEVLERVLARAKLSIPKRPIPHFLWARLRLALRFRGMEPRVRDNPDALALHRVDVTWVAATTVSFADPTLGFCFVSRHLQFALDAGDLRRLGRALIAECGYRALEGEAGRKRTGAMVRRVQAIAGEFDDPYLRAFGNCSAAMYHFWLGEFETARDRAERSTAELFDRCTGALWEVTTAQMFAVWCLFWTGRWSELTDRVPAVLRDAEALSNRHLVANLDCGAPAVRWLVHDDLAGARSARAKAMEPWGQGRYLLFHYYAMLSEVNEALYEGCPEKGWQVIQDNLKPMRKALMMRMPFVRTEVWFTRGRAAVGIARRTSSEAERKRYLKDARRAVRKLRRELGNFPTMMSEVIAAAIDEVEGRTDEGRARLEAAARTLAENEVHGFAQAARLVLETLADPDNPGPSHRWHRDQGVVDPVRFASMLIPGFL